jgi:mono/diheme cytochrome c family protein
VTRRRPRPWLVLAAAGGGLVVAGLLAAGAGIALRPSFPVVASAAAAEPVTFSNQIARLFQEHCQGCHREGEIGGFSLATYDDARRRRDKIWRMVEDRKMPPWKPVPGFGDFLGSRRLADRDVALVRAWIDAGAPEGDPRDLPAPRALPATWPLGEPDTVLTPAESYAVPSGGRDVYRCFAIPTQFGEDRWVSAVDFVPGDRKIVHHVLTYLDTSGAAEALDRAEPGPGYTCFGGPGSCRAAGSAAGLPARRPR